MLYKWGLKDAYFRVWVNLIYRYTKLYGNHVYKLKDDL